MKMYDGSAFPMPPWKPTVVMGSQDLSIREDESIANLKRTVTGSKYCGRWMMGGQAITMWKGHGKRYGL